MEVKDEFVADVTRYSGPLREAAKDADRFSRNNDQAALAARRMGLATKEAADKASRAQKDAADAAEKLARGEIKADEAARAAARAENELERASIKAAEAQLATAAAADKAAANFKQVARDAELAAAAERLGALKSSGAVNEHNAALRSLKARFGDLSKEGDGAFKEIEKSGNSAFSSIASAGPLAIGIVSGVILALPFAAIAAESAITLGIGGALGGLGLMATKSDKDVQAALHGMTSHIKSETKQMAAPFKDTWMAIAQEGRKTFDALAPEIRKDFAVLAPAFTRFAHDAGYALTLLGPAFGAATAGASKLMAALGPKLPEITRSLGSAITIMANSAAAHAGDFANLASSIAGLLPPIAHLLDYTVKIGPYMSPLFGLMAKGGASVSALHDGVVKLSGGLISSQHGLQVVEQTFPSFQQQAIQSAVATGQLMTAQQAAALSSQQLKTALDALTGANQNSFDATTAYRQALAAANTQAKASNAGINGMGKAALANRSALSQLSGAIKNVMQNSNPTSAAIERMRGRFIAAAVGMGVSRGEAKRLADQLLGVRDSVNKIPKSHATKITANTSAASSNLDAFLARVNRSHANLNVDVRYNGVRPNLAAAGGQYMGPAKGFKYAAGGEVSGLISGPGTGTSDEIPAPWLSNGEFVVNSKTTADNTAALMNLNRGMSWMKAGMLGGEKFKKGGKFGIGKLEQKQIARLHAAKARVDHAKARPEYLAAMAAQQALASMRSSVYGGMFRGGLSTPGSVHGAVVQHVTNVNVTVQGSIRSDRDIASMIQRQLLTNRMPVALPKGR